MSRMDELRAEIGVLECYRDRCRQKAVEAEAREPSRADILDQFACSAEIEIKRLKDELFDLEGDAWLRYTAGIGWA